MIIFKMIKDVLIRPSYFFERIEKQKGISKAFFYFAIIYLFYTIIHLISGFFFLKYYSGILTNIWGSVLPSLLPQPQMTFFTLFLFPLLNYIAGLLMIFVAAGLLHVWIYIFGGRAVFEKTFQLLVYSSTPMYLLGWIPFLSFLAQIYSIVLLVIGTQKLHKLSLARSILIYVIPFAAMVLLVLFSMGLVMYFVASNPTLIQQAIVNQPIIG